MYAIFYRGLEHLQILVSARTLKLIPHGYQGTTKFLGSQKLTWIFECTGVGAPNLHIVQGSTVYVTRVTSHHFCHIL